MDTQQNKAILKRWLESWNKSSAEELEALAEEIFTADFTVFDKGQPGEVVGVEGVKQFVREVHRNSADIHITVEDLIAEGEKVAGRYTVRGVNKATGKPEHTAVIENYRFAKGRVAEAWAIDIPVDPQPLVVVKAFDSAFNAGDIDRVMAFFADQTILKSPHEPKIYAGRQQIREWIETQLGHIQVVSKHHQVNGDSVTWQGTLTGDVVKQMGSSSIDEIAEAVVKDGKIVSFTLIVLEQRP